MSQGRIIINTATANDRKHELASYFKVLSALERAFGEAGDNQSKRWDIVDTVRVFVNQHPYELDDVSYQDMRIWLREWSKRMGF